MKLKLVVASMSILGLVSGSVVAATADTTTTTTTTTTTDMTAPAPKHHHHHKKHHHHAQHNYKDYKDMGQPICTVSTTDLTMIAMTQNVDRALNNPCNPGWFNRISVSGGVNVDLGKWGNRNANIMGENYQRLSLNDAYINIGATVNEWAKAFASISFSNPTTNADGSTYKGLGAAEYSASYANNVNGNGNNVVQLEQAYATLGNFDVYPIFLQVGKQFQEFSRYEIHPITASMTQVMSETLATSAKLGILVPAGFHGSVYVFDDPINKIGNSSTPTNYGVSVGYDQINDQCGWDIGAAYLYNLIGANDVAYNVVNFTQTGGYHTRVGAAAAYADLNAGPFTVGVRYTTAVQRFNASDIPQNGAADLVGGAIVPGIASVPLASATGARPWAAGIQAGYAFNAWDKNQNIYVGYQASREAAGLDLPRSRWLVGYDMSVWKDTIAAIEWDHDSAFSVSDGGTGNTTNLVSLRVGVKFS
ncbi:MAG TPA: LbtU family siderophore porin [Gammaproteobacteria bacterium]|nr:LbtU family siderophore porin [Gammaproteobacteria bacterium]